MENKKTCTAYILIMLVLLILLIVVTSLFLERVVPGTQSQMIFEGVELPTTVSLGSQQAAIGTEWVYHHGGLGQLKGFQFDLFAPVPPENIFLAYWIDTESDYYVKAAVINYVHPIAAWFAFLVNDPAHRLYGSSLWNFTYDQEKIESKMWREISGADIEEAQCGDGDENLCSAWFYKAVYGQYFLLIEFPGGADMETFSEVVRAISGELETHLSKSEE